MQLLINIIIILLVISFMTSIILKTSLWKSIFYTLFFIAVLIINIPCFVSADNLNGMDSLISFEFELYDKMGIAYIIASNLVMCLFLSFQSWIANRSEYTHFEVKRKYDRFGQDAVQLYVIGKDLDFLNKRSGCPNNNYIKQIDRIEHLKDNCKLICMPTKDKELLKVYQTFVDMGVEIRFYKTKKDDNKTKKHGNKGYMDSSLNLKGQIKINQEGVKQAILTTKYENKYHMMETENQFLVDTILHKWLKMSEEADINDLLHEI